VVSQGVIFSSWSDARIGTLANVAVLAGVLLSFASDGPFSLRREYLDEVRAGLAAAQPARPLVRESDLAPLPEPVQRYVRLSGAVGKPQVSSIRATWTGRIRSSEAEPWMPFTAEQHSFFGALPSRLFFMNATMKHLPVDIFHRFVGTPATFRVRLLSAITVVDAKGPEMNRAETVTLFNDLCVLAPSRLIDPSIRWEPIDADTAGASFTRGDQTIGAVLKFNDAGELIDFVSDDRAMASSDGKVFTPSRWNTPLSKYRAFANRRVASFGEARWDAASGLFTYGEFELTDLTLND